jgi:hypothetical protein
MEVVAVAELQIPVQLVQVVQEVVEQEAQLRLLVPELLD